VQPVDQAAHGGAEVHVITEPDPVSGFLGARIDYVRAVCASDARHILQRVLALTAAIWHNDHIGAPIPRSLMAYDH
jgi:hypothetical protein